jgi:hypothetical protein
VRLLGIDTPDYIDSPPCLGHFGDHVCDDQVAKAAKRSLVATVTARRNQELKTGRTEAQHP